MVRAKSKKYHTSRNLKRSRRYVHGFEQQLADDDKKQQHHKSKGQGVNGYIFTLPFGELFGSFQVHRHRADGINNSEDKKESCNDFSHYILFYLFFNKS
jgi:hypothetical protein